MFSSDKSGSCLCFGGFCGFFCLRVLDFFFSSFDIIIVVFRGCPSFWLFMNSTLFGDSQGANILHPNRLSYGQMASETSSPQAFSTSDQGGSVSDHISNFPKPTILRPHPLGGFLSKDLL